MGWQTSGEPEKKRKKGGSDTDPRLGKLRARTTGDDKKRKKREIHQEMGNWIIEDQHHKSNGVEKKKTSKRRRTIDGRHCRFIENAIGRGKKKKAKRMGGGQHPKTHPCLPKEQKPAMNGLGEKKRGGGGEGHAKRTIELGRAREGEWGKSQKDTADGTAFFFLGRRAGTGCVPSSIWGTIPTLDSKLGRGGPELVPSNLFLRTVMHLK